MSDLLDRIDVGSPCQVSWDEMQGDARVRFCGHCDQNVYRLTEMPRAEAEALLARAQGGEKVCVRFARRADGTIVTNDCPSTVRRGRALPWARVGAWAAGLVSAVTAGFTSGCTERGVEPAPVPPGSARPPATQQQVVPQPGAQQPPAQQPAQQPPAQQPPAQQPPEQLPEVMGDMVCPGEEQPVPPGDSATPATPATPEEVTTPETTAPQERMGRMAIPAPERGRPLPKAKE